MQPHMQIYTHVHRAIRTPSHTQLCAVHSHIHICKHLLIHNHSHNYAQCNNKIIQSHICIQLHRYQFNPLKHAKHEFRFYYHLHFSNKKMKYRDLCSIAQPLREACI